MARRFYRRRGTTHSRNPACQRISADLRWKGDLKADASDGDDRDRLFLEDMRRSRAALEEQIKQGQLTIEKSKELLKRLDEIIDRTASKAAD
jgi:hypothetical protein